MLRRKFLSLLGFAPVAAVVPSAPLAETDIPKIDKDQQPINFDDAGGKIELMNRLDNMDQTLAEISTKINRYLLNESKTDDNPKGLPEVKFTEDGEIVNIKELMNYATPLDKEGCYKFYELTDRKVYFGYPTDCKNNLFVLAYVDGVVNTVGNRSIRGEVLVYISVDNFGTFCAFYKTDNSQLLNIAPACQYVNRKFIKESP